MLGTGQTLFETDGPVWVRVATVVESTYPVDLSQSIAASDYHPQLAVGASDGSLLTTNVLKPARRGGLIVRTPNFGLARSVS